METTICIHEQRWNSTRTCPLVNQRYKSKCSPLLSTSDHLDLKSYIASDQAKNVIRLFNQFSISTLRQGFQILFAHFIWNPNGLSEHNRDFIRFLKIAPTSRASPGYDTINKDEDGDSINTAATDGDTLWINTSKIMNRAFDSEKSHFGKLPSQTSHFSAVMLHEFGHMIRKRASRTTFQSLLRQSPGIQECFERYQERLSYSRAPESIETFEDVEHEMEEWVADMFSKSFIRHAMETPR